MARTSERKRPRRDLTPSPPASDTMKAELLLNPGPSTLVTQPRRSSPQRKLESNHQPRKAPLPNVIPVSEDDSDYDLDYANRVHSSPPRKLEDRPSHDERVWFQPNNWPESDEFFEPDEFFEADEWSVISSQPVTSSEPVKEHRTAPATQIQPPFQENQNTGPTLSPEQEKVIEMIKKGKNVFFTGSAGCGKSTVLRAAVEALQNMGKIVHVIAPTGRAAVEVAGTSTWSYMGWSPESFRLPRDKLIGTCFHQFAKERLRKTDVIIIDEISMVENHHLERMNFCVNAIRGWSKPGAKDEQNRRAKEKFLEDMPPFNGIQVIVTGDFCQLPPVQPFQYCIECGDAMQAYSNDTKFICPSGECGGPFAEEDKWAFKSPVWEALKFEHIHLRKIHRQEDLKFIKVLQKCRLGAPLLQHDIGLLLNHPCEVYGATRLFCTRNEVAAFNQREFHKLRTDIYEYWALDGCEWKRGRHKEPKPCTSNFPDGSLKVLEGENPFFEEQIELRTGMLVLLKVNLSLPEGLCNGSQGVIVGFEQWVERDLPKAGKPYHGPDPIMRGKSERQICRAIEVRTFVTRYAGMQLPLVRFQNGKTRTIYPWCIMETWGDKEPFSYLHRTQIPLMAGWALSVHKSQGMTLNRVIVDLTRAFEEGQVYVALSRATRLEGLRIEGNPNGLHFGLGGNPHVRAFLREKFPELGLT